MYDLTEYENQEVARIQKEVERWLASKKPGEYLRTDKNRELLTEYLEEHGLDVTAENLETAHYALLSANPCLLDEDSAGGLNFANIGQRGPSSIRDTSGQESEDRDICRREIQRPRMKAEHIKSELPDSYVLSEEITARYSFSGRKWLLQFIDKSIIINYLIRTAICRKSFY